MHLAVIKIKETKTLKHDVVFLTKFVFKPSRVVTLVEGAIKTPLY